METMMANDDRRVTVFGKSIPAAGEREFLDGARQGAFTPRVEDIKNSLQDFVASLKDILPMADTGVGGMGLNSVSIAVGIDGKGKVGFLGSGVEVGATATMTLTFERPDSSKKG
jgi:hypothetical protein